MSSNNVVWYMQHDGLWHVWYSGCIDNLPKEPNFENEYYKEFKYRSDAILYGHSVVKEIDKEAYKEGYFTCVEYGVCEVPVFHKKKDSKLDAYLLGMKDADRLGVSELIKSSGSERDCDDCYLYSECDHQGAYQKDGKWCYEDSGGEKDKYNYCPQYEGDFDDMDKEKLPEYSLTQKGLDAVNQIIKNSPQYKGLKRQIYEDILACRGMSYKEMVNYLVKLEEIYDEK